MIINLAGTTFLSEETKTALEKQKIIVGDNISVEQKGGQKTDIEADYAIYVRDLCIGWVPKLSTIQKYIAKEIDDNNRSKHDMQVKRYKITKKIREQIILDYTRNYCEPKGFVTNILPTEAGYSISVSFED